MLMARLLVLACLEGSAETPALPQGNKILLELYKGIFPFFFNSIAHKCGSLTAAKVRSYQDWKLALSPGSLEAVARPMQTTGCPDDV